MPPSVSGQQAGWTEASERTAVHLTESGMLPDAEGMTPDDFESRWSAESSDKGLCISSFESM